MDGQNRKWLEKLKRAPMYAAPALVTLSGHAAAAEPEAPAQFPVPVPTLDAVGLTLLVGGLAAAGGVVMYRRSKGNRQDVEGTPGDRSQK
jgi:hypothetical protein